MDPRQYLDLCCYLYQNSTLGSILSNQSISTNLIDLTTSGITLDTFPKIRSCCLLKPTRYELDIVTNNLIPIYEHRGSTLERNSNPCLNGSSTAGPSSPLPEDDFNYAEIPFINDIWNTRQPWEVATKTLAVIPLVIVAILGNLTVIRIVIKARLTKNPVNLFILNMSIADLLISLIFPWVILVSDFYQRFVLGRIVCKLEGSVLITLMLTSVLSLTAISYDRLKAVVFPFHPRMGPRRARIMIYCIWIISIIVSSPLYIWRSFMERQWLDFHEVWCKEDIQKLKDYWLVLIVLLVWIPICILTLSYTTIVIKLDTLEKRQRDHPVTQVKSKSRIIRMLFIILIVFAICWTPFTAAIFIRNQKTSNSDARAVEVTDWFRSLFFISHYLMFVNSAVNPIIYGLKNDNLRREFRNTLPACLKKQVQVEVSTIGNKKLTSNKKTTAAGLITLADKYAIILTPTVTVGSGSLPSLSSFERRNSALVDLGLPVPPEKTDDFDLLECEYQLFEKRE